MLRTTAWSQPMTEVKARIAVGPDHRISGIAPAELPPGEHEAIVTITPRSRRSVTELPVRVGPWDDAISLHRKDLYDADGR